MTTLPKDDIAEEKDASCQEGHPEPPVPEAVDAGSVDKIRDILFGNQARDYDKRFAKMEAQLKQDVAGLKEELLKRVDTLESYIKQEIKDLNTRLKNEARDRSQAATQLQRDFKEMIEALTGRVGEDEELLAERSAELREQILEQSKRLSAEIAAKHDQASQSLKQAVQNLDDAKMNRSDLSGFLLDIAMRISGDDLAGKS